MDLIIKINFIMCNFKMNTFTKNNITRDEITNTLICSKLGITPTIISFTDTSITMDRYNMTYFEYVCKFPNNIKNLNDRIIPLIDILHSNGYIHEDLHENNIVVNCDTTGNISDAKIIDFSTLHKLTDSELKNIDFRECKWDKYMLH